MVKPYEDAPPEILLSLSMRYKWKGTGNDRDRYVMRGCGKIMQALAVGILLFPASVMAGEDIPKDVSVFVHDAEICQYLSGEFDDTLPDDRKKEIIRESDRHCSGIDKRQKRLGAKYAGRQKIISRINAYDFGN